MNKFVAGFDLKSLLDLNKQETMFSLNCHALATIQSFNPDEQTVTATINYPYTINGRPVQYPLLIDVPIIVMSGGAARLTFPITPGDNCLILFNDRDISAWFSSGNTTSLDSQRTHSLADGFALIGVNSLRDSLEDYDPDRAVLSNRDAKVAVGSSLIELSNDVTSLKTLINNLLDILAATTVAGIPLDDSALFTAYKTQIGTLLQ